MGEFFAAASLLFFVIAVAILFYGRRLAALWPSVARLHEARNVLGSIKLHTGIPSGDTITVMCRRLFSDLIASEGRPSLLKDFEHRSIGDIVEIVHYRDRAMRRAIKDLRTYAFVVLIFGGVRFLKLLYCVNFVFSLPAIWQAAVENPLDLFPLFQIVMLLFFLIRVSVELRAISELLED